MLKKLQKTDKDTKELIKEVQKYLFSVGIRTSKERAWDIFQNVFKIPYMMMLERNDKIPYQGAGRHITHNHGEQLLTVKNIGKFELKGVSDKKSKSKRASIRFVPSYEIKRLIEESVEVLDIGEEE